MESGPESSQAIRCEVRGELRRADLRDATVERAEETGVLGWVRDGGAGEILVHAEGTEDALGELVAFLEADPAGSSVEAVEVEAVKPKGHEQFAIRGVSAGRFEVTEVAGAKGANYELRLEVDGRMRAWALPKEPSMDPAVKRMAFEIGEANAVPAASHTKAGNETAAKPWDEGTYEQGGRVPWPEAIERGHAVFVLRGAKLRGGFALQRIRSDPKPHWLLIKRRDEHAQRRSE